MATKISITMSDVELAWIRKRAKQVHGGNLSAALMEAVIVLQRQEALRAFLDHEGVPPLDAEELAEIQREWQRPAPTRRRSSKKRGAA